MQKGNSQHDHSIRVKVFIVGKRRKISRHLEESRLNTASRIDQGHGEGRKRRERREGKEGTRSQDSVWPK